MNGSRRMWSSNISYVIISSRLGVGVPLLRSIHTRPCQRMTWQFGRWRTRRTRRAFSNTFRLARPTARQRPTEYPTTTRTAFRIRKQLDLMRKVKKKTPVAPDVIIHTSSYIFYVGTIFQLDWLNKLQIYLTSIGLQRTSVPS